MVSIPTILLLWWLLCILRIKYKKLLHRMIARHIKTRVHVQQTWDIVPPQHWPDRESDSQTVSASNFHQGCHTLSNISPFYFNHFSCQSWWRRRSVFIHSSHTSIRHSLASTVVHCFDLCVTRLSLLVSLKQTLQRDCEDITQRKDT